MTNIVDAVWAKATAFALRWRCVVALIVLMFSRAAARSVRRRGSTSAGRLPTVGQQLSDAAVQLCGHTRERSGSVCLNSFSRKISRLVGDNYLVRRVASRRNVTRWIDVVFSVFVSRYGSNGDCPRRACRNERVARLEARRGKRCGSRRPDEVQR